jgi:hypothetical protein
MFTKILIANRGDKPHRGAAAQPKCLMHAVHAGDLSAMEVLHVQ